MKHHILVNDTPLCESTEVLKTGIACNHLTETRAKTALLRLIELNPSYPITNLCVSPGFCSTVQENYGDIL